MSGVNFTGEWTFESNDNLDGYLKTLGKYPRACQHFLLNFHTSAMHREADDCSQHSGEKLRSHDDAIKWKYFPRNWPFVREFTGPGEFPTQRPVTQSFDVFFDLRLNKRLNK